MENGKKRTDSRRVNEQVSESPWANLTEQDLSKLLLETDELKHARVLISDKRNWAIWNEGNWQLGEDAKRVIQKRALEIVEEMPAYDQMEQKMKNQYASGTKSENIMKRLILDAPRISASDFDRMPDVLNTPGGLIDLRSGNVMPAEADDMVSRKTAVSMEDIPTPKWDKFLKDTFREPGLLEYIHLLAGYCITGETGWHVMPYLYGAGANGKSVFINTFAYVLGTYSTKIDESMLLTSSSDRSKQIARAKLKGVRFAYGTETRTGARIDEAELKTLTGGDMVYGQGMYSDADPFLPTHKIMLAGNTLLELQQGGVSVWRRIKLIELSHVVSKDEQNPNLEADLRAEAPGILKWLVDGAKRYYRDYERKTPEDPECVRVGVENYQRNKDHVHRFLAENCQQVSKSAPSLPLQRMYARYQQWCEAEDIPEPLGNVKLKQKILEAMPGVKARRTSIGVIFDGLALQEPV